jgi:hypothetical protein
MEAIAMLCFLSLLFPVISLTDDLHPEIVAVDAASGKRNACLIAACAPQVRATTLSLGTHSAIGVISQPFGAVKFFRSEFVPLAKFHKSGPLASNFPGRSPPFFL